MILFIIAKIWTIILILFCAFLAFCAVYFAWTATARPTNHTKFWCILSVAVTTGAAIYLICSILNL